MLLPPGLAEPQLASHGPVKVHSASSAPSWNQGPAVLLEESPSHHLSSPT